MDTRSGRERPIPAHPYRDAAIVYGALASILVILAALTGADVSRAVVVAGAFFIAATAWSWWRFRLRIREAERAAAVASEAAKVAVGAEAGVGSNNGKGGR